MELPNLPSHILDDLQDLEECSESALAEMAGLDDEIQRGDFEEVIVVYFR